MIPGSSSCHKWTLIFMYASAEKIVARPKVIGSRVTWKHLIHTFICIHSFTNTVLLFFFFCQGLGQGKIIETSANRLWYLTVFFSHCQHSPSLFRRKEAIVCSCESHWTGWALLALLKNIQGQPKVQCNNKGRCSMLTETGDRIGSKAGGDISSLFLCYNQP